MAQATTTKTVSDKTCTSTLTWRDDVVIEEGVVHHRYTNTSNSTSSNSSTTDFSIIPADATIISATYNSNFTESVSGYGYQTIRNGSQMYDYANNASLKRWLTAGNRTVKIMYSYTPNIQPVRWDSAGASPTSAYRTYRNISMTVKYEAGTKTWLLHYGIGENWEQVEAYVCEDGAYKPVKAYYGTNGGWVLCENHDIEGT